MKCLSSSLCLAWFGAVWPAVAAELLRGPYLQLGTPNSVIVKWRTDQVTESIVRYGLAPDELELSAVDLVPTTEHAVQILGLTPNTKYFYSIGSITENLAGGDENHFFLTHPIAGQAKPTRIWAIGDAGTASAGDFGSHLVRDAYLNFKGTNHTDVWLMLGDNAYYDGWDHEYQVAVFETYPTLLRNILLWSTMGNHETYSADDEGHFAYYDIFTLPTAGQAGGTASGTEKYYSFDYANIHFVCLDSELSTRTRNSPMWNWLQQDLEANTNDWLIAFWHSPPYSKGSHNSDNRFDNNGNMIAMRTNFVSLLEAYGVDLVLCGHSHIYERSYLLNGHYGLSTSLQPTMIKDSGSGRPEDTGAYIKSADDAGAVYIVAGSSGWATSRTGFHPVMFFDELELGSLVIDVNTNRMDVRFLRETGAIDDYFTILKGVPAEPLRIVVFKVEEGEAIIRWKSIAGRTYRVQSTLNLQSPDWTQVSGPIIATGATTSWRGFFPFGDAQQFYRVVEE
jgi:acid phosphatase type 7